MPTREVPSHFSSSSNPHATGDGPINQHADHVPQSLVDRHKNLAARPNKTTSPEARRATAEEYDRVRSTGAQSPGSLAAEIRAQIKHRNDAKETEAKKKKGEAESKRRQ